MEIFIQALQLLTSLSILIILHELGHFIPAKLFKTRVEKFYLFFDPWFSVLKKKIGDTEYGIGWLPLGGYVKISGMIDESLDKEQMKQEPKPWEFRSKPAWQRLIIMSGGVIVNFLLGFLIYSIVLFFYGDKYLPNKNLNDGIWCISDFSKEIGLLDGDKIISADGVEILRFEDLQEKIVTSKKLTVERSGNTIEVVLPDNVIEKLLNSKEKILVYPRIPAIISGFSEETSLPKNGFLIGDRIIEINGEPVLYFDVLKNKLQRYSDTNIVVSILRDNQEVSLTAYVDKNNMLGFLHALPNINQLELMGYLKTSYIQHSFFNSFSAGYNKSVKRLSSYIGQFKLILSPSTGAYKGLGGFGAIGSLFPPVWDWEAFWNVTAFISLILAFMNLLPIPALDGGHILFLIYEMVAGKPAPEKIIEVAQITGVILLLSLVLYANLNDLFRLF